MSEPSIFEKLKAPFPVDSVHWRAQTLYGSKALALAYIDARHVMARLDEVCGPDGWQDTYEETPRGRLLCTIQLKVGKDWVSKCDGAGNTDVEGDKGAISDAFKRAAVKWGIGRYLYETPTVWAPCEVQDRGGKNVWKSWKPEAIVMFARALGGTLEEAEKEPQHHALRAEVKEFVREMESCADWETWVGFRETKNTKRLLTEIQNKLPQWWDGGNEMPPEFVPLKRRIEILEANLAEQKADEVDGLVQAG